ncbi:iron chaperone [Longispora albida]|uniref:iron chaperone n=1 Tax=Longispora albida TaxID=203523 RepID=UPI00039B294A|nr:DUF1801 domain-containing protein [Longispora albida]
MDVDEYMAGVPAERRAVLEEVRTLCQRELTGFTEVIAYRMPSYLREGVAEVAFASQRQYISLYFLRRDVLDAHNLTGLDVGKGCIRYRRPEAIDLGLIRALLAATAASTGPVC